MTLCVFLGPSLPLPQARAVLDAVYLPPVRQGDVYRAVRRYRPRALGIVDGYFQQVPAVWHKEILWAMAQGVHVLGAASMGALRAAELADFGMTGVGLIARAYRDGRLPPYPDAFEDDDEVAVIHGPAEIGYTAASEAMVNIRMTLAAAATAGVIDETLRDALVALAKARFFPERSYRRLLAQAEDQRLAKRQLDALRDWLPGGKIDQKRADALALLETLGELDPTPKRVSYTFEHTSAWEEFLETVDRTGEDDNHINDDRQTDVLTELRLQESRYRTARQAALLSLLAGDEAQRRALTPARETLRRRRHRFRLARGLAGADKFAAWLAAHDLDRDGFERLLVDDACTAELAARAAPELQPYLLDQLRLAGDYSDLRARSEDKRRRLAGRELAPPDPVDGLRLAAWYFRQHLGREPPEDLAEYAAAMGFESNEHFFRALLREYLYLKGDSAEADSG